MDHRIRKLEGEQRVSLSMNSEEKRKTRGDWDEGGACRAACPRTVRLHSFQGFPAWGA